METFVFAAHIALEGEVIGFHLKTLKTGLGFITHTCYNAPGDNSTGKYIIKIPIYTSGDPEDKLCLTYQQIFVKQYIATGPQMYQPVQRALQSGAKAQFNM